MLVPRQPLRGVQFEGSDQLEAGGIHAVGVTEAGFKAALPQLLEERRQ